MGLKLTIAQRRMLSRIEAGNGNFTPVGSGQCNTAYSLMRRGLIELALVSITDVSSRIINVKVNYKLTLSGITTLAEMRKSGLRGTEPNP